MADDKVTEVRTEKFEVRKGVPIPAQRRGRKARTNVDEYGFQDMAVGDSIVIAGKKNIQKARNAAQAFVKAQGPAWKFQTRDITGMPNGQGGVFEAETYGIWRVIPTAEPLPTEPENEPVPVLTVNPE